jgi:hypothetical protein
VQQYIFAGLAAALITVGLVGSVAPANAGCLCTGMDVISTMLPLACSLHQRRGKCATQLVGTLSDSGVDWAGDLQNVGGFGQ